MSYQNIQLADFDLVEYKSAEDYEKTLLIMHGYGASKDDLAPLARMLSGGRKLRWLFPNAPLSVPLGMGMMGRAWFPIDMVRLEESIRTGHPRDFSGEIPEGFLDASEKVMRLIQQLEVSPENLIVGGFSQGSMIACDIAMTMPVNLAGLVLLSSTLVAKTRWQASLEKHRDLPIFQSHGHGDPLLNFQFAENLHMLLKQYSPQAEFVPFQGGHEIPDLVMRGLDRFIANVVG